MKVPQEVTDIFDQISEEVYNKGVVVFVDCLHRGMTFRIQTSQKNGAYVKRPPKRGWTHHSGTIKDIISKLTERQDEKLGQEVDDQGKNAKLAESFARFLSCFDDKGRGGSEKRT